MELTADTGAFDRISVERAPTGASRSWRVTIQPPGDRDKDPVRTLKLTRNELVALGDRIHEALF